MNLDKKQVSAIILGAIAVGLAFAGQWLTAFIVAMVCANLLEKDPNQKEDPK